MTKFESVTSGWLLLAGMNGGWRDVMEGGTLISSIFISPGRMSGRLKEERQEQGLIGTCLRKGRD